MLFFSDATVYSSILMTERHAEPSIKKIKDLACVWMPFLNDFDMTELNQLVSEIVDPAEVDSGTGCIPLLLTPRIDPKPSYELSFCYRK